MAAPVAAEQIVDVIGSCHVDVGAGNDQVGHPGLYTGHAGEPVPTVGIGGCSIFYDNATDENQEIVFVPDAGCSADPDGASDQGDGTSLIWFFCDTGVSGTNEVHLVTTVNETAA